MKKNFLFLLIGFLLVLPITASAGIIENVTLNEGLVTYDTGTFMFPDLGKNLVYDNYEVTISGGSTIDDDTYAAFCVENAWTEGVNNIYTLLSIDSSLSSYFGESGSNAVEDFYRVSMIAETYYDINKEAAQIAIWEIMFDYDIDLYGGNFRYKRGVSQDTINDALSYLSYAAGLEYDSTFNSNWVLAVNPTVSEGGTVSLLSSQNFIFRASDSAVPVLANPEPATLLLLGAGLIGLAGFGRKRLMK